VVGEASRQAMREILAEVRSGAFARRFIEDSENGSGEFRAFREEAARHPIEGVGRELRSRMAWLQGGEG
jgi:ketol-acid reductoisomerase